MVGAACSARAALLALGIAALAPGVSAENASACYLEGQMYVGEKLPSTPNGLYYRKAQDCQTKCQSDTSGPYGACTGFTWYEAPPQGSMLAGGGCWLVLGDDKPSLTAVNRTIQPGSVVSGNMSCFNPPTTTTALTTPIPNTTGITDGTVIINDTEINGTGNATGNESNGTLGPVVEGSSEGGGMPTWVILLIVLGLVGLCAGVIFSQFGGSEKKKKKKKSTRGSKVATTTTVVPEVEAPPVEAAPLIAEAPASPAPASPAPPSPAVPAGAPAYGFVGYPQARQPMAYMQPQQMTYQVGTPGMMYTTQPQYPMTG